MQLLPSTAIALEHVHTGFLWSRQIGTASTLRRGHCQQLALTTSFLMAVQRPALRDRQVVNGRQAKATTLATHEVASNTVTRSL